MADLIPGAGPCPTGLEVAAARERLAGGGAAAALAALAPLISSLAVLHAACRTVGCPVCLRLTECLAVLQARTAPPVDAMEESRAAWAQSCAGVVWTPDEREDGNG